MALTAGHCYFPSSHSFLTCEKHWGFSKSFITSTDCDKLCGWITINACCVFCTMHDADSPNPHQWLHSNTPIFRSDKIVSVAIMIIWNDFSWVWLNANMSVNSFTIVWPPSCIYKPYNILSYSLFGRLNKNTFCTK